MARMIFSHWDDGLGNLISTNNPATLGPVTGALTIRGVYTMLQHPVTIQSSPSGVAMVQPAGITPFTVTVNDGGSVTLQAPPEIQV